MLYYKPTPQPAVEPSGVPAKKKKEPVHLVKKYRVNPDGTITMELSFTWDSDKLNNERDAF